MKQYINPEIQILKNMSIPDFPVKDDPAFREKFTEYMNAKKAINEQAKRVVRVGREIANCVPYCHMIMTEDLFEKIFGISISVMHGKLEGLRSLNSAVTENMTCLFRMQDAHTVCANCYAVGMLKCRKGLKDNTELNGRILQAAIIPMEYWPRINDLVFRIESFADVSSIVHAMNYIHFMRRNENTIFGVWTTNAGFWDVAIKRIGRPKNTSFILSSRVLNRPEDAEQTKARFPWVNAIFTVFSLNFAADNNVQITCGGRRCVDCMVCYNSKDADNVVMVHELLKSHQTVARNAYHKRPSVIRVNIGKGIDKRQPVKKTYYNHAAAAVLAYIDSQVEKGVIAV